MSVAYSTLLTGLDANAKDIADTKVLGGCIKVAAATIELGTADIDLNDVIHMIPVPSNAVIHSIQLFNDDLDTNATPLLAANIGLYAGEDFIASTLVSATITNDDASTYTSYHKKRYLKGDVISASCYATSIVALRDANDAGVELIFEAKDIANIAKEAWQDAGLPEDPNKQLRIALTISAGAATAAAGTLSIRVIYA